MILDVVRYMIPGLISHLIYRGRVKDSPHTVHRQRPIDWSLYSGTENIEFVAVPPPL